MAKVIYRKYEAKNLNPNYKMVDGGSPYYYNYSYGETAYLNFALNENDGTFTMSGPKDASGTFYAYGSSSKNVVVKYTRYTSGGGTLPTPEKVYKSERVTPKYTKGKYIGNVTAEDGTYPRNGTKDGYWYEWDRFANRVPVISGSDTNIGDVKNDFNITYTVTDADNDEVMVGITVDGKTIQYPIVMPLNQNHTVPVSISDYDLGEHTLTITATDTSNASASKSYNFKKVNTAPTISGDNLDLGAKYRDFEIEYIVQDGEGDDVSVEIKVDGAVKQSSTKTTLGVRKNFIVSIKDYSLGSHTVDIIATDSNGVNAVRTYSFSKVNSSPIISGQDINLGPKNTAFTYTYSITDNENDRVDVVEKFNGEVIRLLNNINLGAEYKLTVSDEKIRQLKLHQSNTIEIEATDGAASTYRRITFVRNNLPPIISDKDKDLGEFTNSLEYNWSATDPEGDTIFATVYLDDKVIKAKHELVDGETQNINLSGLDLQKINRGSHKIKIVVVDDKGFSSSRVVTFTRVVDKLIMKLAGKGIETDDLAKRVLVSTAGVHVAKGATVKYEVCNNSFDDSPTWEDATAMTMANKAFNFTNKDKVAEKAGVDIKVTITRGDAKGQSYISAIGGSFD